jgi:heme/copper-type cytochrome/quinol oxidase subunit 4
MAMLRTVIITGAISFAILAVIQFLTITAGAAIETEYLEFALTMLMFLVILVGSYWFIVRGPGRRM